MFITLEGPEGSGKTSQMGPLVEWLRARGYKTYPTREPGGTSISEQIRSILHSLRNAEMHPRTETLLYQAARAQIVEQVIKPHLAAGNVVISDRYYDSTIAYQGYGHQQNLDDVRALVQYATGGLMPDLTILLDLDVEIGLKRKTQNSAEWNRLDAYTVDFHRRVRAGYLEMVKAEPEGWVVVDASQSWDKVQENLRNIIVESLSNQEFISKRRWLLNGKEHEQKPITVFLSYASNDIDIVKDVYNRLSSIKGIYLWFNLVTLEPGAEWELEIEKAVKSSDYVIVFISENSISKQGFIQKEIRYALDVADQKPEGTVYIIPARLDNCSVPSRLSKWNWVNIFEQEGFEKLRAFIQERAKQ